MKSTADRIAYYTVITFWIACMASYFVINV